MVALKGADIDAFVARPDSTRPIVLVYGPDAGLVRERVDALVAASVDDPSDPFALVRLEGDTVASDPGRLADEAHTVPLFGGRRAVWVKAGRGNLAAAIEALASDPPRDCRVIVEAGDLKKDSALRTACEKAKTAVALPCYVDDAAAIGRLVDQEVRAAGLTIAPDARTLLVSLLGGDRRVSRSEIAKLTLSAHGRAQIETEDVLDVVADAADLALDGLVDAAFAGKAAEVDLEYGRARAAGTLPGVILGQALRHAGQLHRARAAIDAGRSADEAVREGFRNLFFRRDRAVRAALSAWTSARLLAAMADLADALAAGRRRGGMADAITHRALLVIAQRARAAR